MKTTQKKLLLFVLIGVSFAFSFNAFGTAITSNGTGNWNVAATWSPAQVPGSGDDVTIRPGDNITVTANAAANSVTFSNAAGGAGTITVNGGFTLAVTTSITFQNAANVSTAGTLTGGGAITAASISIGGTVAPTANRTVTVISTVTSLSISGGVTLTSQRPAANTNNISFQIQSGVTSIGGTLNCVTANNAASTTAVTLQAGVQSGTLNLAGAITTSGNAGVSNFLFNGTTSTVNYNGSAAQTVRNVTYQTLKINNSAGATSAGTFTVTNLTIGDVTANSVFSDGGFQVTGAGTGTINLNSGTFNLGTAAAATTWPAFTTNTIAAGTTVVYLSGVAQAVSGTPSYQNLTLSGAGQKNAAGAITVNNLNNSSVFDMAAFTLAATTISSNATLRFSGANGLAINLGTIEYYGAAQTVTAGTYTNLNINQSGGDAILGGTTTVNGVLTLSAHNLDIAAYNLLLGSAATITDAAPSASRMIIASGGSDVRKTFTATGSFTFPIGDNTGTLEYSPVTVNVTSGSGFSSAYIGVSVVDAKHPNNASSTNYITRYWNIDQSGITGCVATVTGTYVPLDINGTEASAKAAQLNGTFNQSSNPWLRYTALGGNTLTATGATITAGQVSAFTGITGANPTVGIAGGGVTICSGSSAALTATGTGDPTFLYSWSPTTGLSSSAIANPTASPTSTTAYTVTATDGNGITATNNTTITVNPAPTLTGASQSAVVCAGTGAVINLTGLIPGTTSTISYSINGTAQVPVAGVVANGAGNGSFTTSSLIAANNGENLQITGVTITSSAPNCSQSFTRNVTLTVNSPATITTQPTASQTLCVGGSLNLSVTASGTGLSYQWKKNGTAIGGAISNTYSIASVVATDAATYTVDVTSSGVCVPATVTSGNAVVTVDSPATITTQPTASQTLCVGGTLNLSVTASGTGLTYQWQKNGGAIGGATSNTYSIASVVATDAANYTVVVTSSSVVCVPSSVTSAVAALTVNSPATITTQPTASQTLCVGNTLNLSVTASGTGLSYQWKKNGTAIGGATSNTYSIASVVATDAATYTVDVTSSGVCVPATVTSGNAVVTVDSPATITTQPTASQTLCVGGTLNLSVTASGTGLTYQWKKNGTAIGGATSSTFTIGSVVATDAANYTVVVTSSSVVCIPSSVTSAVAALTVNSPATITTQPTASQTLCVGNTLNLSVTASGTGLSYQWKKNGTAIGGAISNTYSIASVVAGDAATYTVDVTSSGVCVPATVTSGNAVVTVDSPATITTQPTASQTLCVGGTLNLSVTASGTGLTYQWQKNGGAIGGATSNTYSIASVVATDAANYTVVVTSSSVVCVPSSVTSAVAALTVNSPATITTQPTASQTLCVGNTLNLSVTASGTGLSYQWKKNGTAIGGATSNTYSIASVVATDAATYTVDVTSSGVCVPATVTSGNAVVTVDSPATITTQPTASQTLCVGGTLNLSVTASGTGLTYQWKKNGTAIGGATSSTFTIGSVVATDAANYTVVVTSSSVVCIPSSVTSAVAALTVNSPATITTQPTASQTLCVGNTLNLSVTASGTGLSYQWKKNGTAIGGAISNTYSIASVVAGDAATYTVDVTSSGVCVPATVTSGNAVVTVDSPATITTQPTASQTLCVGGTLNLSVTASGTGLTYQWQKNGGAIGGATSSTFTIGSVVATDAANYTVVVTSSSVVCVPSSVTSAVAALTVNSPATITTQPTASQTLCVGNTLNLSVTASGTGLSYQWKKNGTAIGGATSNTYSIASVVATDAATYTVDVTSSGVCVPATVTSGNAVVTVDSPATITIQPTASQTLCVGGTLNLSVTASGTGLTYQWKKNGTAIGGATSSTFTIGSVVATDAANYTVVVTSSSVVCIPSSVTSAVAALTVNSPATITTQPTASQTLCVGNTLNLSVTASGTGLSYQWKKNGTAIGGAISNTYSIASVVAGDAATYTVDVTSSGVCVPATVTSGNAVVTVDSPATITIQPTASQTLCVGGTLNLSVTASGTGLTYQWQKNGGAIGGATSSSYSIASVVAGDAANYTVVVTSSSVVCVPSSVTSAVAALTVNSPATITTQPTASQTLCVGNTLNLSVTASGTGLSYQWKKNGTAIGGATSNTYSIASVVATDAATYTVDVTSSGACVPATVTSGNAVVTVDSPATITTQPTASQTLCVGGTLNLSVTASGTGLTYQWQKNGGAIGGATSSSYSIASVVAGDAANYTVVVTSSSVVCVPSSVTSAVAALTVNSPATITTQPTASQTLCVGNTLNLSVTASGTGLSYQWKKNGTAIGGAISNTYSIASVVATDAATYTVDVTSSGVCVPATVTSGNAVVTVDSPATITTQPTASQTLCVGGTLNLSVTASGTGLTYQWKKNGTAIGGATSSTFTIGSVVATDAANYTVVVTSSSVVCVPSSVTSAVAALTVNSPATITTQPTASQTLCVGNTLNLSVTASGTGLSYQWKKNGTAIGGAISNTYSIASVVAGDAATYTVDVTSSGVCVPATVTSGNAVVTVDSPATITIQPTASQTLCVGGTLNLSVTASGTGLTYQWQKNGGAIGGATSNTYSIASVVAGDAANYTVVVTSSSVVCVPSSVTSAVAALTVNSPATITTQPTASQTLCVGNTLNLSVTASGTGLSYQWKKNGTAIGGAISNTYSIASVVAGDAATYTVDVTSSGVCVPATVTSGNAVVTVDSPATITIQPTASQTLCVGGTLNLSVTASGTGLTYQWQKNGGAIGGATSSSYSIASVVAGDAANYTVVVTSSSVVCVPSSVTSAVAALTVNSPATITTQPTASQTLCVGGSLNLSVTASGTGLSYQWKKNGTAIGGAISNTYSIASVVAGDAATYTVDVTSSGVCVPATVTSGNAVVNVNPVPVGTAVPAGTYATCSGNALNITPSSNVAGTTFTWSGNDGSAGTGNITDSPLNATNNPLNVTYTVIPTGPGTTFCVGASFTIVATVNPNPSFSVTNNAAIICSGATTNLLFNSSTAGHRINVVSVNYNGAGNSGTIIPGTTTFVNGNTLVEALTNGTNAPINVVYGFNVTTPSTSPVCPSSPVTQFVTVQVNPAPTFSITNTTNSICSGNSTSITLSTPTTNGVVTLTSVAYNGATGGTQVAGNTFTNGQQILESLTNSGNTPITVNYTFTVSANGCNNPASQSTTVTLNPIPVITNTPTQLQTTICSAVALNFTPTSTIAGTTYTWTSSIAGPITAGSVTASGGGAITNSPVNSGNVVGTVTYTITPHTATCAGAPVNYVVTVNPIPTAAASSQSICSGQTSSVAISNPNTVSGTSYSWTIQSSSNVTGASAGSGASINQVLSSTDGINVGTVTYLITPSANGCAGTAIPVTVTVNAVPVITNTPTQLQTTICSAVALNFTPTSTIAGTTYTWTSSIAGPITAGSVTASGGGAITNSPVNSGNVVGTVTYTITPHTATCAGAPVNYVVTVNPIPTAAASNQSICSGQTSSVAISNPNTVSGTSYSWTIQSSSNVTGASAGSGASINQVLSSTDGINVGTVTYLITPSANGCAGTAIPVTVTVNAVPVITNTPTQLQTTICSAVALNFTPTSTIAGTTYTWTSSIAGPITAGSVTASGGGAITNSPVNSGNVVGTVTYTITPHTATCAGAPVNYVVTVNPIPTAAASNQSICSGQTSSVAISNPNTVSGTSYSWTIQSSSNVTGASAGSGASINQVLSSTDGINVGTVTYLITPSANGCAGTAIPVTVTVNAVPVITNTPTQLQTTICSAVALNFTPTSTIAGTTYTWTSSIAGPITAGSVTASGGGAITNSPVNSGNVVGTVTYTITPHTATCAGAPVNYVVTVNPIPTAAASNQSICSGQTSSVAISNPNTVSGTSYSWTIQSSSNVTGASAGSGASINQVLSSTDGINVGTVTYLITPSANGCAGTAIPVTVTVNAVPVITNTPTQLQTTICSAVALNFTPTSTIAGTTYTWTSSIAGPITGATASGSSTIMDSPVNTGNVAGTVVYHITPTVGTCNGLPKDYVVTVEPVPSAMASNITVCSGQNAVIAITAGPQNVSGTTFSWTVTPTANVLGSSAGNGSTINQALSLTDYNIGSVTYHITPLANGCTGSLINPIATIDPVALVDAGVDYAVCQPATILLTGTIGGAATSGTWQIVTGGGSISASTVSGTTVTATYTVVPGDITTTAVFRLVTNDPDGAGPCVAVSDLINVAINRAPTVTLPPNYVVCEPATISLTGTIGGSASTGLWNIVTGSGTLSATNVSGTTVTANYTVNPSDVSTTVTFSLTTNDADGSGPCTAATANINVTINQAARVFAPATLAICQNVPSIVLGGSIGGSTSATVWTGGGSGSSYSNASNPNATYFLAPSEKNKTTPITIPLTLTALDPDGAGPCTSTSTQTNLTVNPLPLVFFSGFTTTYLAENSSPVTLNGSQVGGQFTVAPSNLTLTTVANPGDQAVFDPSTVPLGLNTVTYTYTDGNGCTNSSSQGIIINPVTIVDFVLVANPGGQTVRLNVNDEYEVCANQGKILISGVPLPSTGNPGSLITKFKGVQGRTGGPIIPVQADPLNVDNWYILTDGLASDTFAIEYDYENTLFAATSKTRVVRILAGPTAGISAPSSCVKDSIKFKDISTMPGTFGGIGNPFKGQINSWSWNLDPFLSSQQNPTITYPLNDPGKKHISLIAYTNQGCSSQDTTHITVGDYPVPDFNWSSICTYDKTNFKDETIFNSGQGNIVNYTWNFGDGTIITGAPLTSAPEGGDYKKPIHVYSTNGQYNVSMSVSTDVGCNQSISRKVNILVTTGTIAPSAASAYKEDFQASNGGWVPEALDTLVSSNFSWIWGLPNGANNITPIAAGNTSWWTGGNGNTYFNKENSAVNGPCFDLTQLNRPMVSLDYWIDAALNYDGAVMQYSTDGGLQWDLIGSVLSQRAQGINWYKPNTTILGNPGGQAIGPFGWTGTPKMWLNGRFNLDMIPNDTLRKQVRIRIAFSDYGSLSGYDGFAFDNFFVGEKTKNVLVEHFTNANPNPNLTDPNLSIKADTYFNNLYASQISFRNGQTDFNDIQYHVRFPQPDVFSLTNSDDPAARALYYNVQQVPYSVSDGIFSTGTFTQIDSIEIDARALRTPPLTITQIDTTGTSYNNHSLNVQLDIRADTAITYPLYGQVALIETPVVISSPDQNPGTYQNVMRKLLFAGDGVTKSKNMAKNDTQTFSKGQIAIDASIKDPNNLYIVAFIQNFSTKEVLQSVVMPINRKVGSTVTATEPSVGNLDQVTLYPNPAKSKFNISLDGNFPSPCIWKIADQNGIYVMEGNFNDAFDGVKTVNISSLTNGVYFVIIGSPGRNPVYKKLVVLNAN